MRKRGLLAGLAAAALSAAAGSPEIVAAFGKTRSLALYNIHSKDTVDVVYKRDGKYVPEAMEKLNYCEKLGFVAAEATGARTNPPRWTPS